jgi:hypothetical protein
MLVRTLFLSAFKFSTFLRVRDYVMFHCCNMIPGAEALAHGCPKLKSFISKGCRQINGRAVSCLARHCRNLEVINLHGCAVSYFCICHLVELPICICTSFSKRERPTLQNKLMAWKKYPYSYTHIKGSEQRGKRLKICCVSTFRGRAAYINARASKPSVVLSCPCPLGIAPTA